MSGEMNLTTLLRSMKTTLDDNIYVFVALGHASVPGGLSPRMQFAEAEGTTLICTRDQAQRHNLAYEFPCRMITLDVHSALEAVGFIAHIAAHLARHNMGVNPVAGFYHDHLFVSVGREQEALAVLKNLADNA